MDAKRVTCRGMGPREFAVISRLLAMTAALWLAFPVQAQRAPIQMIGRTARSPAAAARATALARTAAPNLASSSASIIGFAWSSADDPVADATLRLRNVLTGRIEATTSANQSGEFAFQNVDGGTYVIELVGAGGALSALGSQFTISTGEMVVTFIRVTSRPPMLGGFFSNAASAAISSAASVGTAAGTELVSPPE